MKLNVLLVSGAALVALSLSTLIGCGGSGNVGNSTPPPPPLPPPTTVVDDIVADGPGEVGAIEFINHDNTNPVIVSTAGCYDPEWVVPKSSFICSESKGNGFFIYNVAAAVAGTPPTLTLQATLSWPNLGQPDVPTAAYGGTTTTAFRAYDVDLKQFGIYQANMDGSNLQLMSQEPVCTGSCVFIGQPRYSHDGRLVYNHDVNGVAYVCIMKADGTNQSCPTPGTDGAFSADGKTVYFTGAGGIYSFTIDDAGAAQVSELLFPGGSAAMVSSDGGYLLFGNNVYDFATGVTTQLSIGGGHLSM